MLIALPDSAELVGAFFGAAKIGAIAVPVNPMARAADYRHWLENCGARIAIVHAPILGEFCAGVAGDAALDLLVVYEGTPGTEKPERVARRIVEWDDWLPVACGRGRDASDGRDRPGVLLVHIRRAAARRKPWCIGTRIWLLRRGITRRACWDCARTTGCFRFRNCFSLTAWGTGCIFRCISGASTILYPERPRADEIAAVIAEYRPTVFFSVPTFYASLLRESEKGLALDFSSLRLAVSAGESLPAEIFEQFRKRFGIEILDGIGSSEMLHIFLSSRPGEARAGSCGREVPGYEARILDDAGEPAADRRSREPVGEGRERVRGVLADSGT